MSGQWKFFDPRQLTHYPDEYFISVRAFPGQWLPGMACGMRVVPQLISPTAKYIRYEEAPRDRK